MATTTTVQIGTYSALTDSFTLSLDINDRTTYYVDTIDPPQAKKETIESWNIRTVGEQVLAQQHRNRVITITLAIRGATVDAVLAAATALQQQLEKPLPLNMTLKLQAPNATRARYSTVQYVEHDIPYFVKDLVANGLGGKKRVHIAMKCLPFSFSIPRQWLSNAVSNPGFEAPTGGGTAQTAPVVFNDSFANVNAYTVQSGSAPTVSANVMTIPSAGVVSFGSPAWGAIFTWQVRFKWVTSLSATFFLHHTDGNNWLRVTVNGTQLLIDHNVAGTVHNIATQPASLTTGNFYWLSMVQFPSVPGSAPNVLANLYNDNAGVPGTLVQTTNAVATFDAVTSLVGQCWIQAGGAALSIGGAFSAVNQVQLFGPGAWLFNGNNGTGDCSGAWDTSWGNPTVTNPTTYPNGPVTSFGAGRIDIAPAGTCDSLWNLYGGGAASGTQAMPVQTPGNVLGFSVYARSNGLHTTNGTVYIVFSEYNSSGAFLRSSPAQSLKTGSQTNGTWVQLSGAYTTGANCAYVDMALHVNDTTVAGESANATVWFDNAQVWDQTRTGMATMPYCELRFPNSPAQLLVSGVIGDERAPCAFMLGTSSALQSPQTVIARVGRRASVGASAKLVDGGIPFLYTPVLDGTSYGGNYRSDSPGPTNAWNDQRPTQSVAALLGTYHIFQRFWINMTAGNLPKLTVNAEGVENPVPSAGWSAATFGPTVVGPITAASQWTMVDTGLLVVPGSPLGGLNDPVAGLTEQITTFWFDPTNTTTATHSDVLAYLPVDGEAVGSIINPSNNIYAANTPFWSYWDGSLPIPGRVELSIGNTVPQPASAVGATSISQIIVPGIVNTMDPILNVDPKLSTPNAAGVNQLLAIVNDSLGAILPVYAEVIYSPQYDYPL